MTIDNTHPAASAVSIAVSGTGNANDGDIVTLTIDPSETIGTPTCTWTDGSGAMADTSVEYAAVGGPAHPTAKGTVDSADQDGTVGFSCTFSDSAGNAVAAAVTAITTGSAITIDNTHPTVSSITFADTALKAGETSLVTIVFSEAVASFDNTDLTIAGGTMSAVSSADGSVTFTSTFTPTADTEDDTNVLVVGSSYTDSAGNAATSGLTSGNYAIETLRPTATIAMTTSNSNSGLAKQGDTITLTITMSESVTSLSCTIDGEATTMGGSGTGWTSALTLSGDETEQNTVFSCGSAEDGAGNTMVTDTSANTGAVTVDLTAPIVGIGTVATDGYINAAEAPSFTITGTASGANGQTVSVTFGGATETATVSSGAWTMTMCDDESCSHSAGLSAVTANVNDAAGNAATQANVNAWYDAVAPTTTISSIDISADTGSSATDFITKTASQTITATLSTALATGETLQISLNAGTSWASDDHATADGTSVSIASQTLSGTSQIQFRIIDLAANAGSVGSQAYTLDTTAPTSSSAVIAVSGTGNGNDGDVVTLTLDPSETVQQPTCTWTDGDGAMADTSVTYGTTGSDSHTAAVTVDNADQDGTVGFSCTYSDLAGNAIASAITSATSGAVTIDNTHPAASAVTIAVSGSGNAQDGDVVTLTIDPSETIGTPTCTWTDGSGAMADTSVTYATVGGTDHHTAAVTVDNADEDGTVGFSCTFSDSAGNAVSTAVTALTGGSAITIDNTHPTLTAVGIAVDNTGNANMGDDVTLTFTASEAIGTPTCTFTSGGAAMADSTITVANPSGNEWTCVVDVADADTDGAVAFSISFTDSAGNAGSAVSGVTDSSAVTVDNTHPTLNIVMSSNGNTGYAKSGQKIILTITASEAVTGLVCTIDAEATTMGGSGTSWTSELTISGDETEQNTVFSCASHVDAAGNAGVADSTANSGAVIVDYTAPTSTSAVIAVNNAGNANDGDVVTLTLNPSETVGTPTCTWTDGDGAMADTSVTYGTTGDDSHTAAVTVDNADQDGTVGFSCTYSDLAGNAIATAITGTSDSSSVTIDNTHPAASAVTIAVSGSGNAQDGDVVTLTIDPSETIGTPTCTWTDGSGAMADTSVTYATVGGTDHHTAAVTVDNADEDGTVGFSCTFSDSAGNAVTSAVTALTGGSAITIDNTHPTISSVSATWGTHLNAAEDDASKTITIVTSGAEDGQTVTTTINSVTDSCSVSSNTCAVTYAASDMAGLSSGTTYTIAVDVSDAAGNAAAQNTGTSFVYDNVAPTISSIAVTGVTSGQYGNSGSTYTVIVTASETLSAAPTLTLSGGGVGSGTGSTSDTVWTYTFTPTDADESVTIDVAIGAISDSAANANTAAATQFAFTHDATVPT